MAINLEEHKFFEFQRKMDVVPYSIAKKAVEEAYSNSAKVEQSLEDIKKSLSELNSK